ncbi:phosphate-starvation-inducible PsiE family protein [Neptuniibacter sp.]|uniref:phosphate-starvation-inducible PsiE family protein n=1 Tax=Neptuniibacter sp. TaxID=1962643 RepID=UPI003B5CDE2E
MYPHLKDVFNKVINFAFAAVIVMIIIAIMIGVAQLVLSITGLLEFKGISGHYIDFISDILTIYVLVELSRSLIEYFHSHRLRLTFILDAAIIFIIRELLIGLFKHNIEPEMLFALSVFLFVLGALRIASIVVYLKEKELNDLVCEAEK